jgi:hypothetical protein
MYDRGGPQPTPWLADAALGSVWDLDGDDLQLIARAVDRDADGRIAFAVAYAS